ncbi:hypothetical protein ACN47A_14620 [Myxococcus fulvus]|uniref:hypothetical protein n=1 Tax=Myxococcus fulvus TaxID=33 RepID=UPI003B9A3D0F
MTPPTPPPFRGPWKAQPSEALLRDLERWLKHYLLNVAEPPDHRALARELNALPLYSDMGALLAIRLDGQVLTYDWETRQVDENTEGLWKVVALTARLDRHPGLMELLPARSPQALDCEVCQGKGFILLDEAPRLSCGSCWGLGWRESPCPPEP